MAVDITLQNLASLQNENTAIAVINGNSAAITTAFQEVLSRQTDTPNQMIADYDMNSFRILNLPAPADSTEPVRLGDIVAANAIVLAAPVSTVGLVAKPGSLFTTLRSDSAPALDQSIAPTWTSLHTFHGGIDLSVTGNPNSILGIKGTQSFTGSGAPGSWNYLNINDFYNSGQSISTGFLVQYALGSSTGGARIVSQDLLRIVSTPIAASPGTAYNQYVAHTPQAIVNNSVTGPVGNFSAVFASNPYVSLGTNASGWSAVTGAEYDIQIQTGATVAQKNLLNLVQIEGDAVQGTVIDACLQFWCNTTAGSSNATFTGVIGPSSTTLVASAVTGTILVGERLSGTGVARNTTVVSQSSGTPGGAGNYVVSISQTVSSTAMTATNDPPGWHDLILIGYPALPRDYPGRFDGNIMRTINGAQDIGLDFWTTAFTTASLRLPGFQTDASGNVTVGITSIGNTANGFLRVTDGTNTGALYLGTNVVKVGSTTNSPVQLTVNDSPIATLVAGVQVGLSGADQGAGTINANTGYFLKGARVGGRNLTDSTSYGYGDGALTSINTTSMFSTAVGYQAGQSMQNSLYSTFVGYQAGQNVNGVDSIANTYVGYQCGQATTTGAHNTAYGGHALWFNQSGSGNVAIGPNTLESGVTASNNTAVGYFAMIGNNSFPLTGIGNVAIGSNCLENIQGVAASNVAVGAQAGDNLTTGSANTLIGNTAGLGSVSAPLTGAFNSGLGDAVFLNIAGAAAGNTAIGAVSQYTMTTGTNNTSLGYNSMGGAFGGNATPLTGNANIAIGSTSLLNLNGAASSNVAVGSPSGAALTTGSSNVLLGPTTGATLTTGSNNILIGNSVDVPTASTSGYLNIGGFIKATAAGSLNFPSYGLGVLKSDASGNVTSSLVNINVKTATFTTPAGSSASTVYSYKAVAGGGGGGGSNNTGGTAGGGGAGGFMGGTFTGVAAGATVTITLGAAGTAGNTSGTSGGNGGSTTISATGMTTVTVSGGTGGTGVTTAANGAGGVGGAVTAGSPTLSGTGQAGQAGFGAGVASTNLGSGMGGNAGFGFGFGGAGSSYGNASTGTAATGYGAGGGGALYSGSAGGVGTAGWCEVTYIL